MTITANAFKKMGHWVSVGLVSCTVLGCSGGKSNAPTIPGDVKQSDTTGTGTGTGTGTDMPVTTLPVPNDGSYQPVLLPKTLVTEIVFQPAQHLLRWRGTTGQVHYQKNVVRYKASSTMIAMVSEGGLSSVVNAENGSIMELNNLAFDQYGEPMLRVSNRFIAFQDANGNGQVSDINGQSVFTLTSDMENVQVSDSYIAYRLRKTGQWKVRSANGNELNQIPADIQSVVISDRFLGAFDKTGKGSIVDAYTNRQIANRDDFRGIGISTRLVAYQTQGGGAEILKESGESLRFIASGVVVLQVSHEFAGVLTR